MGTFEEETKRIQKIVEELCAVGKDHDVLDFIEALGATLATYLVANGGQRMLKHYLTYLIKKGSRIPKEIVAKMNK